MISSRFSRFLNAFKINFEDEYRHHDEKTNIETEAFIERCFLDIISHCEKTRKLITRDYMFIPEFMDMQFVKNELKRMIAADENTRGYVNVWTSSGRVINWCIDYKRDRI